MASILGKIEKFDRKREEWLQYVELLDHFFVVNNIMDGDKKRTVFWSVVGPKLYEC